MAVKFIRQIVTKKISDARLVTSEGKPVGLVYAAIVGENFSKAKEFHFSGSRSEIKIQAADKAFELLTRYTQ